MVTKYKKTKKNKKGKKYSKKTKEGGGPRQYKGYGPGGQDAPREKEGYNTRKRRQRVTEIYGSNVTNDQVNNPGVYVRENIPSFTTPEPRYRPGPSKKNRMNTYIKEMKEWQNDKAAHLKKYGHGVVNTRASFQNVRSSEDLSNLLAKQEEQKKSQISSSPSPAATYLTAGPSGPSEYFQVGVNLQE